MVNHCARRWWDISQNNIPAITTVNSDENAIMNLYLLISSVTNITSVVLRVIGYLCFTHTILPVLVLPCILVLPCHIPPIIRHTVTVILKFIKTDYRAINS